MASIIPKRLSRGRIVQQVRLAIGSYDMATFRVLYVYLIHEGGKGDNEPGIVVVGPKDVATGILSTTDCLGYRLSRSRG